MKVIATHTKFEFNMEERKALEIVENLIDLIYNAMREDERFLDNDEFEMQDISDFFDRFERALNRNEGVIECTDFSPLLKND